MQSGNEYTLLFHLWKQTDFIFNDKTTEDFTPTTEKNFKKIETPFDDL